ncbi:sugar ABC transporter substrate-binding protein [Mycetocola sp.]|uniref:sugar ABC transporter substrate-binding protein n=1 Tax=Mycetocola sp. TaxID=1871042 RepID=UPI0026072322|nr:sugar ABC transporter substrate-binding protein [Mycetocola sp.]MCU1420112.1 ABC-type sugar transport system periplasmic component-like protein [Mycetocola sp.]MCU1560749.1 ABC-type sugar transport system periplasmic component-like protein [Mycetocola sp.]
MHILSKNGRRVAVVAIAALGVSSLAACSSPSGSNGSAESDGTYSIAVLLASSQNGYNQAVAEGVQKAADSLDGKFDITVLDGGFNADTQLSQMETAGVGEKYDGIVVVPFDGPALAAAFPLANGIPVTTALNPIGPDIEEMEPQVEGVVATVAVPAGEAAAKQAEGVVEYCADIDPCKVALLVGQLNAPLDVTREAAYRKVLEPEANIEIVATVEGNYDPDLSSTAISNVLQANPDINVVLSNADQQTEGAQIALEDAGIDPSTVYLTGGGGTSKSIQNVRDGVWKADYINFPVSMGKAAMEQLYNALTGGDVTSFVNADEVGEVDPYATKETLDETPDYTGEWVG